MQIGKLRIRRLASNIALLMVVFGPGARGQPLMFEIDEGLNLNRFYQRGPIAAHLVLRSGRAPRLLVVFPAGNSGVGLWFGESAHPFQWRVEGAPRAVRLTDARGRVLHGIRFEASIDAGELEVQRAALSSVRVLRDIDRGGAVPGAIAVPAQFLGRSLDWARDRLDGAAGYRLIVKVTDGTVEPARLLAGLDGRIGMQVTALTGERPLHPYSSSELFAAGLNVESPLSRALRFLTYREKCLAGSWRFDTYFGRDSLISLRLLMPALTATVVESGLRSVLSRLSSEGEVAHEEDIGEQAILDHLARDGTLDATPVYDYKMVDGSFLLAPVLNAWLLEDARGRARAVRYLASTVPAGGAHRRLGQQIVNNLRWVLRAARPFALEPVPRHLIGLRAEARAGNWRDSDDGLGGGRYPYDVNAVLVPAALRAIARLYDRGWLTPYLDPSDAPAFANAGVMARVWADRAPHLFEVVIPAAEAEDSIRAYSAATGVPVPPAEAPADEVHFMALALDAQGHPIPIEHSDEGFALLFGTLQADALPGLLEPLMRPFPAGLMSEAGLLVANPVFAPAQLQARFSRTAYHGTVIWSWQQALLAAGIERQLARADLGPEPRALLLRSQRTLWQAIGRTLGSASELWSWTVDHEHLKPAPFGARSADADESNAVQLWSTVYLALHDPGR